MSRINRIRKRRNMSSTSSYSRLPSRRVRKEKKKVMTQSVMMIGVSILLGLAFIFVIIPNFVNFFTNILDSSSPFQEIDKIPPQIPIISTPISATNSADLKISGFGEPESFVVFIINGSKQDQITIKEDGSFEVDVVLNEGENRISAYSIDQSENESSTTKDYLTIFDNKAPEIKNIDPPDGTEIQSRANESMIIKGELGKNEIGTKIFINGRTIFPKSDGTFAHIYQLQEGDNKIEIIAQDKAGNSSKLELNYKFSL
jgi:hypothetical protein